ncbi:MAG: hypothetical protein ILO34_02390 [Kiritimatiellae bacterium]|nr:hypothetical protein [Kiritimatiellia bacterium]
MAKKEKDGIFKVFTLIAVVSIVVAGVVVAWPAYRTGEGLKRKNAELAARIEERKREISELRENMQRYKTDSGFVERLARQERRVYPGELVFVFDE